MACYDLLSRNDLILSIKLLKQKLCFEEGERNIACIECMQEQENKLSVKDDIILSQKDVIAELKKYIKFDRENRKVG